MNTRKMISALLCMAFLISNSNCYAKEIDLKNDTSSKETYILDMEHGEFTIDSNDIDSQDLNSNNKKIKVKKDTSDVYEIVDADVLKDNKEYNKLIKVNEDTLLRVKEIKINLLDSKQIEDYIVEYDINSYMANDIRNLSNLAQLETSKGSKVNKANTEILVYTPNFSKNNNTSEISTSSLSPQGSYYYTGYNGKKYKEEIWFGKNTPKYWEVRKGYTLKDYFDDTLNNYCNFSIAGTADALTGKAYSIAALFTNSPILTYPSSSGDLWQTALNESKWRKYTSIEMWDDITSQYKYYCRAISDRSRAYFSHYIYRGSNGKKDYRDDKLTSYEGIHYYELDRYAYKYMYDLPYTEYLKNYSVNKFTQFVSQ